MGHQIIRQPDGALAVYSTGTDTWILTAASPEDVEDYYAGKAAEEARRSIRGVLTDVLAGEPRKAYYEFAVTFEEANTASKEHGGSWWESGEWVRPPG